MTDSLHWTTMSVLGDAIASKSRKLSKKIQQIYWLIINYKSKCHMVTKFLCSPVSNGFVYGIKSKTIQMTFAHFARRQLYKSEVRKSTDDINQQVTSSKALLLSFLGHNHEAFGVGQVHREIQQRSPISGSRRPSITSMLSSTIGNTSLIAAQVEPIQLCQRPEV